MCTIALLFQHHPSAPLIVAANRDELYARESSGPQLLGVTAEDEPIVGGRDERAGGSWLGVTGGGMLVAITNQAALSPPRRTARSRGELVTRALACGSVAAALEYLGSVDGRAYNGFNLLLGNAAELYVAYGRSEQRDLLIEPVTAGVHVLGNDVLDAANSDKIQRVRAKLLAIDGAAPLQPQLVATLSDHRRPELDRLPELPAGHWLSRELLREVQATCIHTPDYGTCSASLAYLAPGAVTALWHASGPPCVSAFTDATGLLR